MYDFMITELSITNGFRESWCISTKATICLNFWRSFKWRDTYDSYVCYYIRHLITISCAKWQNFDSGLSRLDFSNRVYADIFPDETLPSFITGSIHALKYYGAVPKLNYSLMYQKYSAKDRNLTVNLFIRIRIYNQGTFPFDLNQLLHLDNLLDWWK